MSLSCLLRGSQATAFLCCLPLPEGPSPFLHLCRLDPYFRILLSFPGLAQGPLTPEAPLPPPRISFTWARIRYCLEGHTTHSHFVRVSPDKQDQQSPSIQLSICLSIYRVRQRREGQKDIYFKELVHMIVKAVKSFQDRPAGWGPSKEF